MTLAISLRLKGKVRQRTYRIVVKDSSFPRDSLRCVKDLGYYLPLNKSIYLRIDIASYEYWIIRGAQPTKRVKKLYNIALKNTEYVKYPKT